MFFLEKSIQTPGRNGDGGAEFLSEKRNYEFFNEPSKFTKSPRLFWIQVFSSPQSVKQPGIGHNLPHFIGIFSGVNGVTLGPNEHRTQKPGIICQARPIDDG